MLVKLPQVLGQMGRGVKAFKDGMNEDENNPGMLTENPEPESQKTVTDVQEV